MIKMIIYLIEKIYLSRIESFEYQNRPSTYLLRYGSWHHKLWDKLP